MATPRKQITPRKQVATHQQITLILCPRTPLPPDPHSAPATHLTATHLTHAQLTHAQLTRRHAAPAEAAAHIRAFARQHYLRVLSLNLPHRLARLSGTPAAIRTAFRPLFKLPESLPPPLQGIVLSVLGLPRRLSACRRGILPHPHPPDGYTIRQIAEAYGFPPTRNAARQTIGILEFGGGFRRADLARFCAQNQIPLPPVSVVRVRGGANRPASVRAVDAMLAYVQGRKRFQPARDLTPALEAAQSTVEVTMDLELLAVLAPRARLVVYFAPPDEQGLYHALHAAIYDTAHAPGVLSISWGQPETALSPACLRAVNHLLLAAAHRGITVCASSGDAGALNHSPDNLPSVNFPASSPWALACGGTTPTFAPSQAPSRAPNLAFDSTPGSKRPASSSLSPISNLPDPAANPPLQLLSESVWNSTHHHIPGASGGGVSRTFPIPPWQQKAGVPLGPSGLPGRGVPDVAGPADPRVGGRLLVCGHAFASAGTSAVAPLWAALVACANHSAGRRLGHLQPLLYPIARKRQQGLRPVPTGNNGAYAASPHWNPCTGHGTPSATNLLHHLITRR